MSQQTPSHHLWPQVPLIPVLPSLQDAWLVQLFYVLQVRSIPTKFVHSLHVQAPQKEVKAVKVWCLAIPTINTVQVI